MFSAVNARSPIPPRAGHWHRGHAPPGADLVGGHGVETVGEIINCMRAVAPARQSALDQAVLARLGELTRALIAAKEGAAAEHGRFLGIAQRGLCLPEAQVSDWLSGTTVMVTGGTGCIGSTLMAQVAKRGPARLVSVSRGNSDAWLAAARRRVPAGRRPGSRRPGGAHPRGTARRDLPRGRAAGARPGRGGGAPHRVHQRAGHPQRAGGGRGGGSTPGGLRLYREGAASLLTRHLHRIKAGGGVGRVERGRPR